MARHTISEAARLVGKDRTTIQRHIKSGKLSKETDANGNPTVDTSELQRVYGTLNSPAAPLLRENSNMQRAAPGPAAGELEVLKVKLEQAERERDLWKRQVEKAEAREQEARAEAHRLLGIVEKQTLLLDAPRAEAQTNQQKRRWPKFWR